MVPQESFLIPSGLMEKYRDGSIFELKTIIVVARKRGEPVEKIWETLSRLTNGNILIETLWSGLCEYGLADEELIQFLENHQDWRIDLMDWGVDFGQFSVELVTRCVKSDKEAVRYLALLACKDRWDLTDEEIYDILKSYCHGETYFADDCCPAGNLAW